MENSIFEQIRVKSVEIIRAKVTWKNLKPFCEIYANLSSAKLFQNEVSIVSKFRVILAASSKNYTIACLETEDFT